LIFAKVPQTPDGLLDVVNKFGRLTLDQLKDDEPIVGDNVKKVLPNVGMISEALGILRGHVGNLPKWQGGPVEYDLPTTQALTLLATLHVAVTLYVRTGVLFKNPAEQV
jgi:hypothetical protein